MEDLILIFMEEERLELIMEKFYPTVSEEYRNAITICIRKFRVLIALKYCEPLMVHLALYTAGIPWFTDEECQVYDDYLVTAKAGSAKFMMIILLLLSVFWSPSRNNSLSFPTLISINWLELLLS